MEILLGVAKLALYALVWCLLFAVGYKGAEYVDKVIWRKTNGQTPS